MIKTVRKLFFVWDFEKEEKWLNEMSAAGLQLCGVGFCTYHFEEGAVGEYTYRLEMLDNWPTHAKSVQYIQFVEETGAEHIGSIYRWVYFRKKTKTQGDTFEIYSDIDSRISHLNRMLLFVGIFAMLNLFSTFNMLRLWIQTDMSVFPTIATITLIVSILLGYGSIRIYLKTRKLKKEKVLRE